MNFKYVTFCDWHKMSKKKFSSGAKNKNIISKKEGFLRCCSINIIELF